MKKIKYLKPNRLQEALDFLNENENEKKAVIAGGTDLIIKLRNNKIDPDIIIDISEVESLKGICKKDGFIRIGAVTTLTELAESDIVKKILSHFSSSSCFCRGDTDTKSRNFRG
jgi:CO/xanthine dehydrogenase FAD-binding subunit